MSLNIISNFAANAAHRNLATTEAQTTASLTKLSSGSRVVSAKDDAASLAIGSRLNAEVQALKQASVNAGQAVSMLQIADGAMARVNDILVRMKTLSVQAGSGQLSSTERSILDSEFQALTSEIDRIAQDTEFNGQTLVNGSTSTTTVLNGQAAGDRIFEAADGFAGIALDSDVGDAAISVSFNATDNVLTLTNLTTGVSEGVNIGGTAIALNEEQSVRFNQIGATITLHSAFDKTTDIAPTGAVTEANDGGTGSIDTATITLLNADVADAVETLSSLSASIDATTANSAGVSLGAFTANAVDLSTVGTKNLTLSDGTSDIEISFVVTEGYTDGADLTVDVDDLGTLVFGNTAASSTTDFSFKLGTGTSAQDNLDVSVSAVSVAALGLTGTSISGSDGSNADTASAAVSTAIDTLNTSRAGVGASQNRIDFASANLSTAIENAESARSALLDLDVANEISVFTSKQVLLQAGVSMLAQANQLPQNLLRLFN